MLRRQQPHRIGRIRRRIMRYPATGYAVVVQVRTVIAWQNLIYFSSGRISAVSLAARFGE